MEVDTPEEQQFSSGSTNERSLKRPRLDGTKECETDLPTEECKKHPSLYLEDGSIILRCEDTLFRFYIGILSRKSEIFRDMFGLAPIQPADSEKSDDGVPVVRVHDPAEDFAYLLSALLDYESLFLQKYISYPRFAALLRLSIKYEMEGIRKLLIHHVQKYYPVEMSKYEDVMDEHGTAAYAAFTVCPHPNEVLKLFWECDIKQCLPVAFYEATTRGVNSLTSLRPKVALPPQILTPAFKALATLNSKHVDHVRLTMVTPRVCAKCRRADLVAVEHQLAPTKSDLAIFPLRDSGDSSEVSKALCEGCFELVKGQYDTFRDSLWNDLPGVFGLPAWKELSKHVILK